MSNSTLHLLKQKTALAEEPVQFRYSYDMTHLPLKNVWTENIH